MKNKVNLNECKSKTNVKTKNVKVTKRKIIKKKDEKRSEVMKKKINKIKYQLSLIINTKIKK